jgi:hypothetical protein
MQRAIIHAEGVFFGGNGGAGGFIHAEGVRVGFPSSVPKGRTEEQAYRVGAMRSSF